MRYKNVQSLTFIFLTENPLKKQILEITQKVFPRFIFFMEEIGLLSQNLEKVYEIKVKDWTFYTLL